jgi:hypothetical protein
MATNPARTTCGETKPACHLPAVFRTNKQTACHTEIFIICILNLHTVSIYMISSFSQQRITFVEKCFRLKMPVGK